MARKYYRNNKSKEEDKRRQYFGQRELKLQTIYIYIYIVFYFFFEVSFELGACHKIRTRNKVHKWNMIW